MFNTVPQPIDIT
jgi:hypothetical protein